MSLKSYLVTVSFGLMFSLFLLVFRLSYVNHAEDLASKLLQCSPKNRLSAQAALSHEYFSDLPPRLWELTDSE
jgi:serine/threonine protein kinase